MVCAPLALVTSTRSVNILRDWDIQGQACGPAPFFMTDAAASPSERHRAVWGAWGMAVVETVLRFCLARPNPADYTARNLIPPLQQSEKI